MKSTNGEEIDWNIKRVRVGNMCRPAVQQIGWNMKYTCETKKQRRQKTEHEVERKSIFYPELYFPKTNIYGLKNHDGIRNIYFIFTFAVHL